MKTDTGMVRTIKNHKATTEMSTLKCSGEWGTMRVSGYNRRTLIKHKGITTRSGTETKRTNDDFK